MWVGYAWDVALNPVGLEPFWKDEPEGVVGWVCCWWCEYYFPWGSQLDVGVSWAWEQSAGSCNWDLCEGHPVELAVSCDDHIFEKGLHDEIRRNTVVHGIADVVDDYCYVADRNVGEDIYVKGSARDGPRGNSEGPRADCIPDPGDLVEEVGRVLEGEGDGNLSIGVDAGVGMEEEWVGGGDVLGGLDGEQVVGGDGLRLADHDKQDDQKKVFNHLVVL